MRTIWFLLLPGTHVLDLGGPLQALRTVVELDLAPVAVRCIALTPEVQSFQGLAFGGLAAPPATLAASDVLLVVGYKRAVIAPETLRQAARWVAEQAARTPDVLIGSICTGAFVLGEAGLLDGRQCTTHHNHVADLQARFPRARVLDNRLFVDDRDVFSSAGVASGIDLALHLIERLFGRTAADRVARELVIYRRRAGDDPQLRPADLARNHLQPLVHRVQDHIDAHYTATLSFAHIARRFNVSYRHLARLFRDNTGQTLQAYQRLRRLERARDLLRDSSLAVERIAERCGYGSSQAFRLAWRQEMDESPLHYRAAVRMADAAT